MRRLRDLEDLSIGKDDLMSDDVIAAEAIVCSPECVSAAEEKAGDSNGTFAASGNNAAMGLKCVVDVAPACAGADADGFGVGVERRERSMVMPLVMLLEPAQFVCPPLRIAKGVEVAVRAVRMVDNSAALRGRMMALGEREAEADQYEVSRSV